MLYSSEHFEDMSWHDNKIHEIKFIEEKDQIVFEIDFINGFENKKYSVSPAKLSFLNVSDLKMNIGWSNSSLELMIHNIERSNERLTPNKVHKVWDWQINILWPKPGGQISFTSTGYEMMSYDQVVLNSEPKLLSLQREDIIKNRS